MEPVGKEVIRPVSFSYDNNILDNAESLLCFLFPLSFCQMNDHQKHEFFPPILPHCIRELGGPCIEPMVMREFSKSSHHVYAMLVWAK